MGEDKLISVIVPIYKVEAYLDQCVQSIVDQTYRNLEIILVDDGSPDRCPAICDEWAKKDRRIKVIHKTNGGGGDARNAALEIARGELVGMVDSDDYIEPHMYEHLYDLMTPDVDIAECGMMVTESDDAPLEDGSRFEYKIYSVEEAMRLHIQDQLFRQTPPNKLYRRSAIGDARFPVGNRIDDEFWTYKVIGASRKLVRSSCKMYAYRQQQGSVMHLSFAPARLQAVDAKCQRLAYLRECFPALMPTARTNLRETCLFQGQMCLMHLHGEERKQAVKKLLAALRDWPMESADCKSMPFKRKVWIMLADKFFVGTCRMRNMMRIGI